MTYQLLSNLNLIQHFIITILLILHTFPVLFMIIALFLFDYRQCHIHSFNKLAATTITMI